MKNTLCIFLLLSSQILFAQPANTATELMEFDSRDASISAPEIKILSLDIVEHNYATKIGDHLYIDEGGCHGCSLLSQVAKYSVTITVGPSLKLSIPGEVIVWEERTATEGREYLIPNEIVTRKTSDEEVLAAVAGRIKGLLNLLSSVRRKTVESSKDKCYSTYITGIYNPADLRVTSFSNWKELASCPPKNLTEN